eukprot:TRINITY_DN29677_c0_g1_i1.p1 TRINITY_DN29677_c0_g1~~TRINITY_DN29677_c0_g1_i1.p1  ORF type:complete len:1138 (+),score=115.39 TRINITY_DN29677_c0_g1_i1:27-3440(+)
MAAAPKVDHIKALFKRLDKDGDGFLTKHQVLNIILALEGAAASRPGFGRRSLMGVLDAFDANRDGKVDCCEFIDWIMSEGKLPDVEPDGDETTSTATGTYSRYYVHAPGQTSASAFLGEYKLNSSKFKGRPYWTRVDKSHDIFFGRDMCWHIGGRAKAASSAPFQGLRGDPGRKPLLPHELKWQRLDGKRWEDIDVVVMEEPYKMVLSSAAWTVSKKAMTYGMFSPFFYALLVVPRDAPVVGGEEPLRREEFRIAAGKSSQARIVPATPEHPDAKRTLLRSGDVSSASEPLLLTDDQALCWAVEATAGASYAITFDPVGMTVKCEEVTLEAADALSGCWKSSQFGPCEIDGFCVRWPDGAVEEFEMLSSGKFLMRCEGTEYQAWLTSDGVLQWSDGDTWTRKDLPWPWLRVWSRRDQSWYHYVDTRGAPHRMIERAEQRAMTLEEFGDLAEVLRERCVTEKWASTRSGKRLRPCDVNLYDLNHYLIRPSVLLEGMILQGLQPGTYSMGRQLSQTMSNGRRAIGVIRKDTTGGDVHVTVTCGSFSTKYPVEYDAEHVGTPTRVDSPVAVSYKELVCREATRPLWFCSHWWGEPVLSFISCCREHARLRKLDKTDCRYWVCAYANRQHDLGTDMASNPEDSSFRRAMNEAVGVLLILDESATPFHRIWCDYELYKTMLDSNKCLDVINHADGGLHLLADGILPGESMQSKRQREIEFPIHLIEEGLSSRLENGSASRNIDKVRILKCMLGKIDDLDNSQVLDTFDQHRECFDVANNIMHAHFAVAAWPQALIKGVAERMRLAEFLSRDSQRQRLVFDFRGFHELVDEALEYIASGFPSHVRHLSFDCARCSELTCKGIAQLAAAFSVQLETLVLKMDQCLRLTDYAILEVANKLPRQLQSLTISCSECRKLTDAAMVSLSSRLPSSLQHLEMFFDCSKVSDEALLALSSNMPPELQHLCLSFTACDGITDNGVSALAGAIPHGLQHLTLYFSRCWRITDRSLEALSQHLPTSVRHITFAFSYCDLLSDAGMVAVAKRLPKALKTLELHVKQCTKVIGDVLWTLGSEMPEEICCIILNFEDCSKVGKYASRGLATFAAALPNDCSRLLINMNGTALTKQGVDCTFSSIGHLKMWLSKYCK